MKNIFLLLTITMFCSFCKSTKPSNPTLNTTSHTKKYAKNYGADLNGNWELKSLWGMDSARIGKAYINMNFENRSFSGNAGCNDINGNFSFKDDLLIVDKNINIAKNECPAYIDKKFISMLLRINRFEVNDNILELSQDNIVLMTFKRNN